MVIKRRLFMDTTENKWEARAVLNPTVIAGVKGVEHMFYRAVSKEGISSIGYAKITKGQIERYDRPVISPTEKYEKMGVEDPRITKIGKTYYMLYVGFDGKRARIVYATSKNLKDWKKKGIISPNISLREARKIVKIKKYRDKWKLQKGLGQNVILWDKDAVLFPKKINGYFVMLHRVLPDIQIVKFKKFSELKSDEFWRDHLSNLGEGSDKVSLYRRYDWEGEHIGAGAVPIKTKEGWLLIYHGVDIKRRDIFKSMPSKISYKIEILACKLKRGRFPYVYHAGAALLDLKKPETEITRLKEPLFSPEYLWEKEGEVDDVVFPEGVIVDGDNLKIYYGCSDSRIGLAEMSLKGLLKKLGKSP